MAHTHGHDHHDDHSHHIVPLKSYWLTLAALLVLTVITVGASYINFGSAAYNWAVAIAIASAKASLVMMVFMGLKWDNNLNRLSILGTFVALAVFVWLGTADLWYRIHERPMPVKKAAAAISMDEVKKLEAGGPEQVEKGKALFAQNCATCHGNEGRGDGPAGAALNPKPRDFTAASDTWTNGSSKHSIYVTLAEGVKNTGMAGYPSLPVEDRWALVHYVRSLNSAPAATGKADARYASVLENIDGVGPNASAKEKIPVDLAIDLMVKEKGSKN